MLTVDILTPDRQVYTGEAEAVTVPGTDGSFQVRTGHAAIISTLAQGKVMIRNAGEETVFQTTEGVVEVQKNKVIILVEKVAEA